MRDFNSSTSIVWPLLMSNGSKRAISSPATGRFSGWDVSLLIKLHWLPPSNKHISMLWIGTTTQTVAVCHGAVSGITQLGRSNVQQHLSGFSLKQLDRTLRWRPTIGRCYNLKLSPVCLPWGKTLIPSYSHTPSMVGWRWCCTWRGNAQSRGFALSIHSPVSMLSAPRNFSSSLELIFFMNPSSIVLLTLPSSPEKEVSFLPSLLFRCNFGFCTVSIIATMFVRNGRGRQAAVLFAQR